MIETKGRLVITRGSIFKKIIQFRESDESTNQDLTDTTISFTLGKSDGDGLGATATIIQPPQLGNVEMALTADETAELQLGCGQSMVVYEEKDGETLKYEIPVDVVDASYL